MTTTKTIQNLNVPATGTPSLTARIRDLPPLIVSPIDPARRSESTELLGQLDRKIALAHRSAATAATEQGEYARALLHLESAVRFDPTNLEYLNQLGHLSYVQGDEANAITAFETVLQGDAANGDAWFNLGMVRFGKGEVVVAEDCFRRSLDANPQDAETWNNRGVCLFQIGKKSDARICFENALRLDGANEDARVNLASC
jgi:Flp pilus assembly protein TadD